MQLASYNLGQNCWDKIKNLFFICSISHHSFNEFLSITTYNFLKTYPYSVRLPSLLVFTSLWPLLSRTQLLQKPCQGNFKDPARVGLVVLKKIVIFWRFQNGSITLFRITREENWFLISLIILLKHLYELKFPENIDIDHVFQYEAFFRLSSKLPQRLLNVTLPQVSLFFFKHVASKNQLTGFYIGGTLG